MNKNPLTWREFLVQAALLLVLLVPVFPGVFLEGKLFSAADMLFGQPPWDHYAPDDFEEPQNILMFDPVAAFRPDWCAAQAQLLQGNVPLWNPLEHAGVPLVANCQSSLFYPPRLLLLVMDVDTAMTLFVLLRVYLCGLTAYLCARLLPLPVPASRFFSIAWMCGTYCLIWCHWPETELAGWLPVLFLGTEFILGQQFRRGFFTTALGATGLLIAGHFEVAFAITVGLGIYFFVRVVWMVLEEARREGGRPGAAWKILAVCGGAWVVALLACMVQVLPFIEYLAYSWTFAHRDITEHNVPLTPGMLVTFWVPRFFGTGAEQNFWDVAKWNSNLCMMQYSGMAVWAGVLALVTGAAASVKNATARARIGSLAIASALGLLLSMRFPTLNWIHELPPFSSLLEIYNIFFALFAIPLLGAVGLERWFSKKRKLRELLGPGVLATGIVILVVAVYRFHKRVIDMGGLTGYVHAQLVIAALFALLAVAVLMLSCVWYRPRILWTALTAVLFVDLLIADHGMNPTLPREHIFPETKLTTYLQEQGHPCRVSVVEAYILPGAIGNYGIEEWYGYDGLFPERVLRFQRELGTDIWDKMEQICGIRYYFDDPRYEPGWPLEELLDKGAFELVGNMDGLDVYRNRTAFPRAFLAREVEFIPDRDELFARMREGSYRPERTVLTDREPSGVLPQATAEDLGAAKVTTYEAERVVVEVDAAEDAVLVLTDAFYPGWQATLDGDPLEIFPAYYAFRGVLMPAGEHVVEFRYRPWSFPIGLVISTATLIGGILAGVAALLARARRA